MQASMTVHGTMLKLSTNDTYAWAHKAGAAWPCSTLSGHRLWAAFDTKGNLVDFAVDGSSEFDMDVNEFNAITSDYLRERFGASHPAIR